MNNYDIRFILKPFYKNSFALIIGINKYINVPHLSYAENDASVFKNVIIENLSFPENNVISLIGKDATKENIIKSLYRFTNGDIEVDDRIIIFFAGHGHTVSGYRGDIGYLIPCDAKYNDISTYIRWDEFTRNSELIRAKHIFFIMDACYSGLALTRGMQAGSTRFLRDMLLRYSRQVLTAGKADEIVSDSGGPLPEHSVFTGHLLEGLQGKAMTENGVITAAGLMSYVYTKVANDKDSNQTPHFGHFDGDGDLILLAPDINKDKTFESERDTLISIPYIEENLSLTNIKDKVVKTKELLSNESRTIELNDFLIEELKIFLDLSNDDYFNTDAPFSKEKLIGQVSKYEQASSDLAIILSTIAYWAKPYHISILQKILSRLTDRLDTRGRFAVWIYLKWFPLIYIFYHAGIAAVENKKYDVLYSIFYTQVNSSSQNGKIVPYIEFLTESIFELVQLKVFKELPGHEQHRVPMSEYLFKTIQPKLDDFLYIGKNYEMSYDEFEVLFALSIVDYRLQNSQHPYAPVGRSGWKHFSMNQDDAPLNRIINEGINQKQNWKPLKAGFFDSDYKRFEIAAINYRQKIATLGWY